MSNRCHGFSLVEVLASSVVLSVTAIGITGAWRLADSKALVARLDHRASRILREYYELQTFAPAETSPFSSDAPPQYAPADPINGFLYHPLNVNSPKDHPEYDNAIPYSIEAPESERLTLTYTVPGIGAQSSSRTVTLNASTSP